MDTLLLAVDTWDLCLDASGNIAVAKAPYALAQDVATAVRTFLGEVYYNTTLGVPYDQEILAKPLNITTFAALMVQAALGAAPTTGDVYVVSANCIIDTFDPVTRIVTGQLQFTDNNGVKGSVSI